MECACLNTCKLEQEELMLKASLGFLWSFFKRKKGEREERDRVGSTYCKSSTIVYTYDPSTWEVDQ